MYTNGGTSHLTPMIHRPRCLMFAGSGGSFFGFGFACTTADGLLAF